MILTGVSILGISTLYSFSTVASCLHCIPVRFGETAQCCNATIDIIVTDLLSNCTIQTTNKREYFY